MTEIDPAFQLAVACIDYPDWYSRVDDESLFWRLARPPAHNEEIGLVVRDRTNAIVCYCGGKARSLARVYRQSDGALILWTAGDRGTVNDPATPTDGPVKATRRPAVATHLPQQEGDTAQPRPATCWHCRAGRLLVPMIGWVWDSGTLEPATFARVVD